jgi:hypothetical protein
MRPEERRFAHEQRPDQVTIRLRSFHAAAGLIFTTAAVFRVRIAV